MTTVMIHLGDRSYPLTMGRGLLERAGHEAKRLGLGADPVVVTTRPIARLVGPRLMRALRARGFRPRVLLVPDGERAKSAAVALDLVQRLARWDRQREPWLAAVGGGVVGDLTGFVAAIYKRGIPYVQVPTTLTAQVDSAIGGKTAIDLPVGKNLVGAFYQPKAVWSDTGLLQSLPDRELSSGLAEVVKCGVILDRRLFVSLERSVDRIRQREPAALERIVAWASRLKARVVEQDERDQRGIRMLLNFGHTVGHAIEAATGYSGRVTHGEAVSIGMVAASQLAVQFGLMRAAETLRVEQLLIRLGLPTKISKLSRARVVAAMAHDKKFVGRTARWVLPVGLGRGTVRTGVPAAALRRILEERVHG